MTIQSSIASRRESCIVDNRILAHPVDELQPREGLPCAAVRSFSQLSPYRFR